MSHFHRFKQVFGPAACWLLAIGLAGISTARAADPPATPFDTPGYERAVQKAIDYLRTSAQNENGSFGTAGVEPGISAIVLTGILRNGRGVDDPMVAKGMKYMETFVQPDGGIYGPNARQKNYETCVSLVAFKEANRDGRYSTLIKNADKYLKGLQFAEGDPRTKADPTYGGVGYASSQGADLSNSQFLMDALQAAGNGPDDEAVKRALVFVSRCQNRESEHNTLPFAGKVNDGGFYYSPAGEGRSQAGKNDDGGLRSYGSMTYAGLKSMIFAGLKQDDPRVQAAVNWLQKNYSVSENPGLGDAGLYYYYCVYSKALEALGQETFVDDKGAGHNWRNELVAELAKRQQANGSWTNSNSRWMEGDPKLSTGYALVALSYCRPAKP